MEAKATVKYVRIAPRKVKVVLDLIRNQPVDKAAAILKHTPKAACEVLEKLLGSAGPMRKTTIRWTRPGCMSQSVMSAPVRRSSVSAPVQRAARLESSRGRRTSP